MNKARYNFTHNTYYITLEEIDNIKYSKKPIYNISLCDAVMNDIIFNIHISYNIIIQSIAIIFYLINDLSNDKIKINKSSNNINNYFPLLYDYSTNSLICIQPKNNEIINKDIPMFEIGIVYNNANTFNNNKLIIEISYNELIDVCKLFIDNLSLSRDYMHTIIKEDLYDTIMDL